MTTLSEMLEKRPRHMSLSNPRDSSFDLLKEGSIESTSSDDFLPLPRFSEPKMKLSPALFGKFASLVRSQCGILLPEHKSLMVASQLQKRMRATGIFSFESYYQLLVVQESAVEMTHFVNAITTNKAEFFREPHHFELLHSTVLPLALENKKPEPSGRLFVWSAGCSTGEEPYSLGMLLADYLGSVERLSLLATDIDTKVLQTAKNAIYPDDVIAPVPGHLRYKFLMKGTGQYKGIWRVIPELRERIHFERLNFMENNFGFSERMDIIFCRNVTVYFDMKAKREIVEKFYQRLVPGGFLFLGQSETLEGVSDKFVPFQPTVYRKPLS